MKPPKKTRVTPQKGVASEDVAHGHGQSRHARRRARRSARSVRGQRRATRAHGAPRAGRRASGGIKDHSALNVADIRGAGGQHIYTIDIYNVASAASRSRAAPLEKIPRRSHSREMRIGLSSVRNETGNKALPSTAVSLDGDRAAQLPIAIWGGAACR